MWLRVVLASLAFAFGLNALAHSAHEHSDGSVQVVHATCGFCAVHNGIIDAPRPAAFVRTDAITLPTPAYVAVAATPVELLTSARPRAPPFN